MEEKLNEKAEQLLKIEKIKNIYDEVTYKKEEEAGHHEDYFYKYYMVKEIIFNTVENKELDKIKKQQEKATKEIQVGNHDNLSMEEKGKMLDDYHRETVERILKAFDIVLNLHSDESLKKIYDYMPQGPGTDFIKNFITNPNGELSRKNIEIEKRRLFTGEHVITYNSPKANYSLYFPDERFQKIINTSNRQGVNTRKVFKFLLSKANEQYFNTDIHFTLNEIVERGIYKNTKTAYEGMKACINNLMGLEIEGVRHEGKKEVRSVKSYIFVARDINFKLCTVKTVPDLLKTLCGYYTILPVWAYSLNSKPFIITDYIYSMARQQQNYKKIAKDGYFTISLESLNKELGQPRPAETQRHGQFIINPILDSIEEIENARKGEIKITPMYDHDYKNASAFLKGYLKIELEEAAKNYFTERAEGRKKKTRNKKK